MAENILKLKKRAVEAGMPKAEAMKADRKSLNAFLADSENEKPILADSENEKPTKKAVKKSAAKKKVTGTKKSTKKAAGEKKPAGRKPGRKVPAPRENSGLGRLSIDKSNIDWTAESDDWNPKQGGPVEKLFKALKRSKGNIDKAYALIKDNPHDFVGKTKRDGTKRSKGETEAMLRYRLNRTLYEFATRTGQHESADAKNRAAYGTGSYATTRKVKPTRKATTKTKAATPKKTGAKRGRPKGSKNKKTAKK